MGRGGEGERGRGGDAGRKTRENNRFFISIVNFQFSINSPPAPNSPEAPFPIPLDTYPLTISMPDRSQNLIHHLQTALGVLELDDTSSLSQDVRAMAGAADTSRSSDNFQIAVFGPFNYGKSTLLNAMLGQRTLPIDLIPTTGAAIRVCYGEKLTTKITLKNGRDIQEDGIEILKEYAILDDRRRMRADVESVEVSCCHPFLKTGVEFLDLPGTNDRSQQDDLVRDRLLGADLVVQVLDGRQLMTLGERENLRDWLLDRNITTVVFAVNFLNLMEPDDRKKVFNRLCFVAESFRSQLPAGISNLYRVDALPALRARLKGNAAAAQETGLPAFESALQHIVSTQLSNGTTKTENRVPRWRAIVDRIKPKLQAKIATLDGEIAASEQKHHGKRAIQQKAQKLLQQSLQASLSDFQGWLYAPKLVDRYRGELAAAIEQDRFYRWEAEVFKPTVRKYQQAIDECVDRACEFFIHPRPGKLSLSFPGDPPAPSKATASSPSSIPSSEPSTVAAATGFGFIFGGLPGAAVAGGTTYVLKKLLDRDRAQSKSAPTDGEIAQLCETAAREYLECFSRDAFATLGEYEAASEAVTQLPPETAPPTNTPAHHQRQLCQRVLEDLEEALGAIE